jgi:uncharacterized surface protein with fasciclin (FAS1) repeats
MKKQFLSVAMGVALLAMTAACNSANTDTTATDTVMTTTADTTMAEAGVEVGGAMMVPSKNIVENAMGSSDHTTLVAAVKQAGLVETLSGTGPFSTT